VSVKRALGVLACAVTAGGVGSAVIVGTSASGLTSDSTPPAAPPAGANLAPARVAPQVESAPKATLHLPTTLHLINTNTQTVTLTGGKLVITATLKRKGGTQVGSAVYTCNPAGSGTYTCQTAFALAGGIILSRESVNGDALAGDVTGGTGKYAGASGTVKASARPDGRQNLTIDYATD
jgi:hypothetical protein